MLTTHKLHAKEEPLSRSGDPRMKESLPPSPSRHWHTEDTRLISLRIKRGGGDETLYGAPGGHPATHGCGGQRTSEFFQGTGQPLPFPWPLLMGSGTPGSRYYTLESTGHHPLTLRRHFSTMHSPLVILLTLMWGTLVFTQKQGKATATLCVTMKAWLGSGLDLGRVPSCVHTLHTVCKHRARWRMLSASGLELLIWIHCSKYNLRLCWASLSTL